MRAAAGPRGGLVLPDLDLVHHRLLLALGPLEPASARSGRLT